MARDPLLKLMTTDGTDPPAQLLARWTDRGPEGPWDDDPDYGAFVDDQGKVIKGTRPPRVFLDNADPQFLELTPAVDRSLPPESRIVFIDWGGQTLAWKEIFSLWSAWETQNRILDCGSVGVSWPLATRWVAPGWIAFRDNFDGAPLQTRICERSVKPAAPRSEAAAQGLRQPDGPPLPPLPFTLQSLKDPNYAWPSGVEEFASP